MRYVTYDQDGALTGAFDQQLATAHEGAFIAVTDDAVYANWCNYKADAARTGLEALPAPPPPAPRVPFSVTRRQARQALVVAGHPLASVDAVIAALPEPTKTIAQIFWQDSNDFERHNAMLLQLAPALGLDDAALDALFILAGSL